MNIKRRQHSLLQSELVKNSTKLLSANVIAQVIGFLIYPLLTRLFSADEFGLMNLFLSISGILILIANADYQNAIVLPKETERGVACFQISFMLSLLVSLACFATLPFKQSIAALFNAPQLANYLYLLPWFVFIGALSIQLNTWYTRTKKFGNIAINQVSQSVTASGFKYISGLLGFTNGGLIWGSVIGQLLGIVASLTQTARQSLKSLFKWDKQIIGEVAKTYQNFPKYTLPKSLVNNFSYNLPILLLTPFFSLTEIGLFGMAITLAFRPLNMISNSLYQVFYQKSAEKYQNKQTLLHFFTKYISKTSMIVVPSFMVLFFMLPTLIQWFLGDDWEVTGHYIQVMLPWLFMSVLAAPIAYLSDLFAQQRKGLLFEIAIVVSRTIGLIIGILCNDFYVAIVGYCIASATIIFLQIIWYRHLILQYEKERTQVSKTE